MSKLVQKWWPQYCRPEGAAEVAPPRFMNEDEVVAFVLERLVDDELGFALILGITHEEVPELHEGLAPALISEFRLRENPHFKGRDPSLASLVILDRVWHEVRRAVRQ